MSVTCPFNSLLYFQRGYIVLRFRGYSALRDAACPSRHDDAWPIWHRENPHHSHSDEGDDRLRCSSQRNANEPKGDHSPSDVRSTRRRHQRLDRWNLLSTLEENSENQKRSIHFQLHSISLTFLLLDGAIASRAVFDIVSRSNEWAGRNDFGAS